MHTYKYVLVFHSLFNGITLKLYEYIDTMFVSYK